MWWMFRHPDYDPIDRCQCPDLEKATANADRYRTNVLRLVTVIFYSQIRRIELTPLSYHSNKLHICLSCFRCIIGAYGCVSASRLLQFNKCYVSRCISNCVWQNLIIFMSLVLNNFIQNLFTTKSREWKSDFFKGHAWRPYKTAGLYLPVVVPFPRVMNTVRRRCGVSVILAPSANVESCLVTRYFFHISYLNFLWLCFELKADTERQTDRHIQCLTTLAMWWEGRIIIIIVTINVVYVRRYLRTKYPTNYKANHQLSTKYLRCQRAHLTTPVLRIFFSHVRHVNIITSSCRSSQENDSSLERSFSVDRLLLVAGWRSYGGRRCARSVWRTLPCRGWFCGLCGRERSSPRSSSPCLSH